MPRFEPFSAVRYSPSAGPFDRLVSPPYDVFDEIERQRLAEGNHHNIVHLDYPLERDGPDRYAACAETYRAWLAASTLEFDSVPSFTIYRMHFVDASGTSRTTCGVVGALGLDPDVLPHERTTPKAKTDRLDLLRATGVNLSPVWGLSLAVGLTEHLREPATELGRVVDGDGVMHVVERVDDDARLRAISASIARAPVLIADGHHRFAVSRTFMEEVGGSVPGASSTMAYVAELSPEQLTVEAIHRLVEGVTGAELVSVLSGYYDLDEVVEVEATPSAGRALLKSMGDSGRICVLDGSGRATLLRLRPGALSSVRSIDSARLEAALDGSGAVLSYQHGFLATFNAVRSSRAAAVLINPVSIDEIRHTAEAGQLMPPKSTFFTPKLLTGLVLRDLCHRES